MQRFTVRLDIKDYEKLKVIAKKNSRSINKQIEFIVKNTIKDYERVAGEIKIEQ